MKVLLVGAGGQVGAEVAALAGPGFRVLALARGQLDLCDPAAVELELRRTDADVVVNCAAYTAVDRAEEEPALAQRVNADAVRLLGERCASRGLPLVHLSTDYVFDGAGVRAYREQDPAHPLGVYGSTKLAGEEALRAATAQHVILRISWVFGRLGRSFVDAILRQARQRAELAVVDDQVGAPAPAVAVALAVKRIATVVAGARPPVDAWGTFHFSTTPALSWHGFAKAIVAEAVAAGLLRRPPRVRPIASAEWPTPAPRPRNSRLDASKLRRVYGIAAPEWRGHLASYLGSLADREGVPNRSAT